MIFQKKRIKITYNLSYHILFLFIIFATHFYVLFANTYLKAKEKKENYVHTASDFLWVVGDSENSLTRGILPLV